MHVSTPPNPKRKTVLTTYNTPNKTSIPALLLLLCLRGSAEPAASGGAYALTSPLTEDRTQSVSHNTPAKRPGSRVRRRAPLRSPDVIYYPTPEETVAEMLRLANIRQGDVLYDLGSGDGRIPIMAAEKYGIRAVGIEIDPKMVAVAQENARQSQVANLVSFRNADMFRTDLREATVVTLYLSNRLNLLLRPKLLSELRPGSRIVSHDFQMGDWVPEQKVRVPWHQTLYRTIYLWTVPARPQRRVPKHN